MDGHVQIGNAVGDSTNVAGVIVNEAAVKFEGSQADDLELQLQVPSPTTNNIIALPDASGTSVLQATDRFLAIDSTGDLLFDQVQITVPDPSSTVTAVIIDGDKTSFTQRIDDAGLLVVTLDEVMSSEVVVHIRFKSRLFTFSATFTGRVFDTAISGYIGQTIIPGDAVRFIPSNSLSVRQLN